VCYIYVRPVYKSLVQCVESVSGLSNNICVNPKSVSKKVVSRELKSPAITITVWLSIMNCRSALYLFTKAAGSYLGLGR